ncbi:MAG: hypothetical protein ACC645_19835, partial [Pirellulales bacterium]
LERQMRSMPLQAKHRDPHLPAPRERSSQEGSRPADCESKAWLPRPTRGRVVFLAVFGGVSLAALSLFGLFAASQQSPAFYLRAEIPEGQERVEVSRRFESRATAVLSRPPTDRAGDGNRWSARFTDREVNAWLAVTESKSGRPLIADRLREPRVSFGDDRLLLGFQIDMQGLTTIGSVDLELTLRSPNVLACRVCGAHAGLLPLPLKGVLDTITRVARGLNLPIHWMQADGDPVAMISVPNSRVGEDEVFTLERLILVAGEIRLGGQRLGGTQRCSPLSGSTVAP